MKKMMCCGIACMMLLLTVLSAQAIVLSAIEEQSPVVWGLNSDDIGSNKFVPKKGGIKVCKAEGKLIVGFYLSAGNIAFYSQTFPDGERKPIGFEFDINDPDGVFSRDNLTSITTGPNFPGGVRYDENYMADDASYYTVGINNPTRFEQDTWYTVTFNFSQSVDVPEATFEVNVQLVGDVRKLRDDYHDTYNGYGVDVESQFWYWFNLDDGQVDADGNNFFGLVPSHPAFHAEHFFGWPEDTATGYDRYLWDMSDPNNNGGQIGDYKPYHCGFGSDPWEFNENPNNSGGAGHGYECVGNKCWSWNPSINIMSCWDSNRWYQKTASGETEKNISLCSEVFANHPQVFTEGYHTHTIKDEYRCSNNLCWENGGNTNCYDAYNHYEISNGNIDNITIYRDKHEMCDEVYSDLDIDNDGDGYTENQGDLDDVK